jgi:starvation-inducible DNA-binding protein
MADAQTNSKGALIAELNGLLADHFALFIKTKNFHWHVKGPRFRDLHLLFDDQAIQIRDQIDVIGERVRKQGGDTLTSAGSVSKHTQIKDQDSASLAAEDMIA